MKYCLSLRDQNQILSYRMSSLLNKLHLFKVSKHITMYDRWIRFWLKLQSYKEIGQCAKTCTAFEPMSENWWINWKVLGKTKSWPKVKVTCRYNTMRSGRPFAHVNELRITINSCYLRLSVFPLNTFTQM